MKQITINDKVYDIDCNAYTPTKYKSVFKSGMIKDVNYLQGYMIKQTAISNHIEQLGVSEAEKISQISDHMIEYTDDFLIKLLQITWILIYSANERIEEFEKWSKAIKFKLDDEWIAEVTEFAVNCFC